MKITENMERVYIELGFNSVLQGRSYIADLIADKENGTNGAISADYSKAIGYALADDIANDLYETADHEDWSMDDVRLSFGRVLCKRLNIEN